MKSRLLSLCVLGAFVCLALVGNVSAAENTAWCPGETLKYSVKFSLFNAGTSTFTVQETTHNGRPVYKFQSTITSRPGFFYKIDDRGVSLSDRETLQTYRYEKFQNEGGENSTNITAYNHATGKAVRTEDGKAHPSMDFVKLSKDVLGAIYYVRNQNIAVGKTLRIPVHDGKRDYRMEVSIRRREHVRVPAGEFNCLVVEPKLRQPDGTIRTKGQMTLWMTDDHRHIPVRIKIVLPFGHLIASLTSMDGVVP